jgi:anti-anti-sigma factor
MSLELDVHQSGTMIILRVVGAVSEVDVYRFSQAIRDVVKRGQGAVAIDVSQIEYMESHAIGILVSHFSTLQRQGRELVLINTNNDPTGYMRILLETTRLNEMIRVISPK